LNEAFEKTQAFEWLIENATRFNFRLSYPRKNNMGIVYEPWHWLSAVSTPPRNRAKMRKRRFFI
jgi:LAS superfamily LD-carboxypeptidase LdcB